MKDINPKLLGTSLNILLIKSLKLGHKMVMAEERDMKVLVNVLRKWSDNSTLLQNIENKVDEINQMDFGK